MSHSGKIELFKKETIKFNKKHNLISKKNTEEIIDEGIAEAAALTKYIKQYKNILDIGTGSGLPGIPLAIFNENKNIYLSEKNNKKNYHLKKTIKTLEINNATTVGSSNKNTKIKNKVDCVVTKAFASTKKTLDIANSLNILTESIVFIDDNPFERNLVKNNIKDITVLDLPEDHSDWIDYIDKYHFFLVKIYL